MLDRVGMAQQVFALAQPRPITCWPVFMLCRLKHGHRNISICFLHPLIKEKNILYVPFYENFQRFLFQNYRRRMIVNTWQLYSSILDILICHFF